MSGAYIEQNCFGRKALLDLLRRRVKDLKEGYRQNLAFLGSRHIGKTTLLHKFIADVDDPDIVVVYLDLDYRDFDYCVSRLIKSLLYNFAAAKNLPLHDDIRLLIESLRPVLPLTVESIEQIQTMVRQSRLPEAYQMMIDLPDVFCAEAQRFCVLVIDEFHNLEEFGIPDVFQELGKKVMTQKNSFYIVTSSYPDIAQKILAEKLSLLFGHFETVMVEPFDFSMSQEFITARIPGVNAGLQIRNFLADFTGGHPLYLNLICQEMVHLCALHRQNEIYVPLMVQAIEDIVFNPWGVLSRHFELNVNELASAKSSRMTVSVMLAIANGMYRIKDIIDDLGVPQNMIVQKVNRLVEAGQVEKNGGHYHFKDKLFRYWIKYVYQMRLKSIEMDPSRHHRCFRDELNRSVSEFQSVARKDLSSRMVDLIHAFDNEAFQINGRRYRLPMFNTVTPMRIQTAGGYCFDVIRAASADETWLILLKKDPLNEGDVNIFLNEARKIGCKPQRCVLVALSSLDENTKIRALQEKMWIWNEPEINTLMYLYDKPYIVR